jgi:lipid-A-disaccharide synthase
MPPTTLFLLAGEPSGDMLGGRLMAALRARAGDELRFVGVGGPRMADHGLASLFPMDELSLMGFAEVVPHLPRLMRRMRETVAAIERLHPAMVLTIDSPGFSLRLQRRLAGRGLLRVQYVAPQVWAWHESRARRLARDLDHLLALLPFEPPFFERWGVACSFVGHPIVEEAGRAGDAAAFRAAFAIPPEAPLLCLLPGSRNSEISRHLPVLEATVARLVGRFPDLHLALPTLPAIAPRVREQTAGWRLPVVVVERREQRFDAYAASRLAIAASGTVALEVALAGLPAITIYRTGALTAWLARRLIRVPHVNIVNLILQRPAVPELLQEACAPEPIAAMALRLMTDERLRAQQRADLAEAAAQLAAPGGEPPSVAAARKVLELLRRRSGLAAGHDPQAPVPAATDQPLA